ncbi:MAG: ABC transporter substrate-binding protein [Promethearchaeota archaeon]
MRDNEKKVLVNSLIVLGLILNVSLFYILFYIVLSPYNYPIPPRSKTLIWGMGASPPYIDPTDSWDSQANVVIRQCTESLWWYNYSDPTLPLIRVLAGSEQWISITQLRVTVRQGVYFHDGTPFNADAAIWNLERLEYLCNHTGALDPATHRRAHTASLYEFPDGSPIIKNITKISEFVFDIYLNAPFSDLLDIYAYVCGNMLSPTAHAAQAQRFISLQETLVGTGPFIYESYVADTEIRFSKNENYNGPPGWDDRAYFDYLIFSIIVDPPTRNYAMLAGDIDWIQGAITDLYDTYRADPLITFYESEIPGIGFSYCGMNNHIINVTWRKAISYAVNYTYIISDYYQDTVLRAYGPLSPAFGAYYKPEFDAIAPYMNYSIARQTLLDGLAGDARIAGLTAEEFGANSTNDANWAASGLITFNYSGNLDNQFRADMLTMLQLWFDRIGITVLNGLTSWDYFLKLIHGFTPNGFDDLELYWVVWDSEYFSPMNQIQPLMSNMSLSNSAQVNDPQMEAWFVQWSLTTDLADRIELCHNISEYIARVLYPYVWVYHPKVISVHAVDLYNCPYNALGNFWAYPIMRNETWVPF